MARSLLIEFYLENSRKFEYLGTAAADCNDSSLIREPLMSLKLQNFEVSDSVTGAVCIALWRCKLMFQLAAPQDFFLNKEHLIGR